LRLPECLAAKVRADNPLMRWPDLGVLSRLVLLLSPIETTVRAAYDALNRHRLQYGVDPVAIFAGFDLCALMGREGPPDIDGVPVYNIVGNGRAVLSSLLAVGAIGGEEEP